MVGLIHNAFGTAVPSFLGLLKPLALWFDLGTLGSLAKHSFAGIQVNHPPTHPPTHPPISPTDLISLTYHPPTHHLYVEALLIHSPTHPPTHPPL